MREYGPSTCETVSDRSSWIDVDSGSITSGEILNNILNADTHNYMTADNFSSHLPRATTIHNKFSLHKKSSSLLYKYFPEHDMLSISKRDGN